MTQPTKRQEESVRRYKAFWNREQVDRPMFAFGQPYPAKHLEMSRELQKQTGAITLEQMTPEAFLPSYEALFQLRSSLPGDTFYTPTPVNGFPWIEAMVGCEIVASGQGYSALHFVNDLDDLDKVVFDINSPWAKRYLEFLECLGKNFKNRTGVGQPIMRGIADLLGAIMGPEQTVYSIYDDPDKLKAFIRRAIDFYVQLYREQMRIVPPFLGGYQIGFYDIWAPDHCFWLQDDNLVLFSPEMYEEFFLEFVATVTSLTPYNLIHLHPVCFHNIDNLLGVKTLSVMEVNREMTEKDFPGQMETLKKIQETKLLDLQGLFTPEDFQTIRDNLSPSGLQLKCIVENLDEVPKMYEAFQKVKW